MFSLILLIGQIGDSGYIRSPNYPSAYPADIKCVWWLKAKSKGSQHLGLIFSQTSHCAFIRTDIHDLYRCQDSKL